MTTDQALAGITDEGLFENLVTAILREANNDYKALCHPGVNEDGRTVKSPLDGICFVQGANPPLMIAAQHTITKRKELRNKWLNNPKGDLIKTGELALEERKGKPDLRVTLVLTTNQEPDVRLISDVATEAQNYNMEVDLWSRSRLSQFLDTQPIGQRLRKQYLGIEQQILSSELLTELSRKSLELNQPLDNPDAWIHRSLDDVLQSKSREITFLVARSGFGKSVACFRYLQRHIENGGFGLIVPHKIIESSFSIDQVIVATLQQLHPSLNTAASNVLSLCTPSQSLLLIVEDINHAENPALLVEKIIRWSHPLSSGSNDNSSTMIANWRLICPLWPEILSTLNEQTQKSIKSMLVTAEMFNECEGRDAVLVRATLRGHSISALQAQEIACALGNDPLLIALHDGSEFSKTNQIIQGFIETSVARTAAETKDHPGADYQKVLCILGQEMLKRHCLNISWNEVETWQALDKDGLQLISHLAFNEKLIRFIGSSDDPIISFRHDRVQKWLLADAVIDLDHQNNLSDSIIAEPYYAEIMGMVLVEEPSTTDCFQRISSLNPLALFYALRLSSQNDDSNYSAIRQKIENWLDDPKTKETANQHMRWEALAVLAETDSSDVSFLVQKFPDRTISSKLARLHNGDLYGGIELCIHLEPGAGAPWRDIQIEHAKLHHGKKLCDALAGFLKRNDLSTDMRIGALRLAGHFANSDLALSIEVCWEQDKERENHLADYLWAAAECCGKDIESLLGPICDAWAALPNTSEQEHLPSQRDEVAAYEVRWAFEKWPPFQAIDYFIKRARNEDLRWPITFMLHTIDDPEAVVFIAQELATIMEHIEGTSNFPPFISSVKEDWQRAQENGRPMSLPSRKALSELWQNKENSKHLRTQAFQLWASTRYPQDLEILRNTESSDILADKILVERLVRSDKNAIPKLIEKLPSDGNGFWWQYGRYIWSSELSKALDRYLDERSIHSKKIWGESTNSDWILARLILKLPISEAESLLIKHWHHLCFSREYIQAALYISTPALLELAGRSIKECPEPQKLLLYLSGIYGIHTIGRPGITQKAQISALIPYLHLLSSFDLDMLWEECNDHGWFDLRREYLDNYLSEQSSKRVFSRENVIAMLNERSGEENLFWLEYYIDDFLHTGATGEAIINAIKTWAKAQKTEKALRILAAALEYRGTRKDLDIFEEFKDFELMSSTESQQVIIDTKFAVFRRTIH
jgi:hypothetical protein